MDSETTQASGDTMGKELTQFLQVFGIVFSQSAIYGINHSVTASSVKKSYSCLAAMLAVRESVNFGVSDEQLVIDGTPYQGSLPVVKQIAERLNKLEIASFSLARGIAEQEYNGLVELLHSTPEEMKNAGGFAQVVSTLGMEHVRAKKVYLKQVTEDEIVVSKDKLDAAIGGADSAQVMAILRGEIPPGGAQSANVTLQAAITDPHKLAEMVVEAASPSGLGSLEKKVEGIAESVNRLCDHISHSIQGKSEEGKHELTKAMDQLQTTLAGTRRLAGIAAETAVPAEGASLEEKSEKIAESVHQLRDQIPQSPQVKTEKGKEELAGALNQLEAAVADAYKLAGLEVEDANLSETVSLEEKSERISESVRHLYDHMSQGSQAKTQKGKKELTKALDQLEHELVDKLKTEAGGDGNSAVEAAVVKITESIEEMKEELAIDALAVEYAKKISAIQASQKRILRYINTKGEAGGQDKALMEKLMESGLSSEGWEDLVEKSALGDVSSARVKPEQ